METPPKVHRHRHRRVISRRRNEESSNSAERQIQANESENNERNNVMPVSVLVNGHEPPEDSLENGHVEDNKPSTSYKENENNVGDGGSVEQQDAVATNLVLDRQNTSATLPEIHERNPSRTGILGLVDRELKPSGPAAAVNAPGGGKKLQSLSDPQASPAQRSTRSRSSVEKSPRRKRSKSESRRRRERKLIAAGEMEVRQANETLMRYLKQCSEMNDASLSGELEIDHNFDERRVHRKTKSQRDKRGHIFSKTNGKLYATILRDLQDDIIPTNGEIYNPFTPVVSPTEGPPARIDKMFIQTSSGYRAVDHHSFYPNPIGEDSESNNRSEILTSVNLSCCLQRIWILITNICHGLLGGLALAHLLFIATTRPSDWAEGAVRHYSSFAEIYANTFYCLAIICMVSILDRMDICHIDISSATELISFRWIMIAMIYIATIILTLCAESIDEKLYLTNFNISLFEEEMANNQVLNVWNSLSMARSIGAIFGWIMIGLSPTDDLLYNHLLEMEKYQLTNN